MNRTKEPLGACGCAACASELPRRRFLAAGAAGLLAGGAMLAARPVRAQSTLSPDAALARLMAGNARFVGNDMASFKADLPRLRAATVEKQEPFAALLSCADSRVPVELVFDESIGQIFGTRVAGNVATPEIIASLEYGVAVLGTRVIMVLAHQGCGAVKAAVGGKGVPGQISALYAPLQAAVAQGHHDHEATARINAKIQADILATASPVLSESIEQRQLKVVAGYYSLESGKVDLLS